MSTAKNRSEKIFRLFRKKKIKKKNCCQNIQQIWFSHHFKAVLSLLLTSTFLSPLVFTCSNLTTKWGSDDGTRKHVSILKKCFKSPQNGWLSIMWLRRLIQSCFCADIFAWPLFFSWSLKHRNSNTSYGKMKKVYNYIFNENHVLGVFSIFLWHISHDRGHIYIENLNCISEYLFI